MPHSFIVSGTNPERTLLLVDGSSYLYRAFHALPELKSPKGEPTGAIYGVLNMLRRLAADYKAQARAVVFDAKGVKLKFGVPPEKFVDYLTLVGDAIDNIPGVDKVGPKTAARWIKQYGSLEGVIAHAGEITGSVGENLRKVLDGLPKGRELITVKRDVALPVTLDQLADGQADPSRQRALYERFGFKTWLKEAESAPQQPAQPVPPSTLQKRRYSAILTEGQLRELVRKLETAPLVGFDTECVGLEPMTARLVGMSFAFGDEAVYLPLAHE